MKFLNGILKQLIIALLSCASIIFGAFFGAMVSIEAMDKDAIRMMRRKNRRGYVTYHE